MKDLIERAEKRSDGLDAARAYIAVLGFWAAVAAAIVLWHIGA